MTENFENATNVDTVRLPQRPQDQNDSGFVQEFKVKQERIDAEVEAKLRALNAKIKADRAADSNEDNEHPTDSDADGSVSSAELDDKKTIVPVKSSNEILAELFSVFNAAPPDELLDDKNLLKKKQKKVKKKKRARKAARSDGECSDSDVDPNDEGKHKHKKRKKHKHKHKDSRDKHKDKDREKSKDRPGRTDDKEVAAVPTVEKDKSDTREQERKRHATESDSAPGPAKNSCRHQRNPERERTHNSFYNGFRESGRSKDERVYEREHSKSDKAKKERNSLQHISDVSLSDEETYLREKANGRRRPHNAFYGDGGSAHVKDETSVSKRRRRRSCSRNRTRSRSRSRSRDLGIDKKRLLEIARKNAINMFKRGTIPGVADMSQEVKDKVLLKMRYGGRTVQDLTEFCKKISNGDILSELSSDEDSDVDKNGNAKAFHHPFQLKERDPIVMHIRNSTSLVPSSRREEQTKAITMQFPVSSGQVHRMSEVWVPVERKDALAPMPALPPAKQATNMFKDMQKNVFAKPIPQQEQQEPAFKSIGAAAPESTAATSETNGATVPLSASTPTPTPLAAVATPTPAPASTPFVPDVAIPSAVAAPAKAAKPPENNSVFPQAVPPSMDVSSIITQRLSAIRRLQDNPADSEALKMMYNAQRDMSSWASSKHLPGQFTGSTGAQVMKIHELNSGPQLWVRRDQLTSTKPVTGGMGMALLQKMGWKPGEGLGRTKTGSLQPLLLDVKLDKRGLVSREDVNYQPPRASAAPRKNNKNAGSALVAALNPQDKHPVCVLNELTSKNKWTPPQYTLQYDTGPAHSRMFLFSVEINGQSYTPPQASNTKKEAKLNAAKLCLTALGILPPS